MPELDDELRQGAKAAAAAAAVGAAVGIARAIAARAEAAAHPDDRAATQERPADHEQPQPVVQEEPVDEHDEPERHEPEPEPVPEPVSGTGVEWLRGMTEQARSILEELSGAEVEVVSAIDRTRDGWRVALEAVEVRRIPDSTDVLATYELELDDDGDLVRYQRLRRYARAQSDHGAAG